MRALPTLRMLPSCWHACPAPGFMGRDEGRGYSHPGIKRPTLTAQAVLDIDGSGFEGAGGYDIVGRPFVPVNCGAITESLLESPTRSHSERPARPTLTARLVRLRFWVGARAGRRFGYPGDARSSWPILAW